MIRLTTVILIATFMQVSASSFGQRITINAKNTALEKVLKDIRQQSGYDFLFSEALISSSKPISIAVKNATIEEVLEKCFDNQPIVYKIENKTVLLKEKAPSVLEKISNYFNSITISGTVNGSDGSPLAGATVTIKGGKRSTSTGNWGQFSMKDVPEDAILQISFMGYVTKEIKANTDLYGLKLELSTSKLDEIQVMAYGTTSKRLSTGNITTITAKELENQPVQNPLLALQGRVAGMIVTPANGYASSSVKIEIRGRKTISPDFVSDPLYIIDGVPLNNLDLGTASNYSNGSAGVVQSGFSMPGGQSPFYNLNSKDIESIEVLKDGDATAIYGSRAANGVILVTTKKGKPGDTKFAANLDQGFSTVTQRWNMLNTQQYLEVRREAFKNDNITPTAGNAPDLVLWDPNKYTDWQKQLWGKVGKQTNASMSLSGGDLQTQFRLSGNYGKQTEILSSEGSNQRGSLSLSMGHSTKDRKFRADLNGIYSYSAINTIISPSLVTLAPNAPDIYDENGALNFAAWRPSAPNIVFPFSGLSNPYFSNTHMITSNLRLSYQVLENLSVSSNFGYNSSNNVNKYQGLVANQDPLSNPRGNAFYGTTGNYNWLIEPQIDYKVKLFGGELAALLGGSIQKTATNAFGIYGFNYESDDFIETLSMAPYSVITQNQGFYRYAAVFGRIKYNWGDKYIVNINGRRDGSSRFGPGNQFGNFGSIGAAWVASKEDWAKQVIPTFISFVQLRGSYGLTGSDGIGDYKYLTRWSSGRQENVPFPDYDGEKPLISLQAVNVNYRWQVNKKMEMALSLGFLEDRINLESVIYKERSGNQLTDYPTPIYTGFTGVTANWPAVIENGGWEFTLNAKVINSNDLNWTLTFNGSRNYNKLRDYPDIEHSPYVNTLRIGKSLNTKYVFHYTGIDPLSGSYTFEDYNKDGYIKTIGNSSLGKGFDDQYVELDLTPKFSGGLGSRFSYKNFGFDCFFDFRNQIGVDPNFISGASVGSFGNQPADLIGNYWKKPGDNAKYAKPSTITDIGSTNYASSDAIYKNSSYIRLSNVALSYALDQKVAKKLGASSIRFYMNAQNIFVISKAAGIDPEIQQFGGLPPAKTYLFGLSLNF